MISRKHFLRGILGVLAAVPCVRAFAHDDPIPAKSLPIEPELPNWNDAFLVWDGHRQSLPYESIACTTIDGILSSIVLRGKLPLPLVVPLNNNCRSLAIVEIMGYDLMIRRVNWAFHPEEDFAYEIEAFNPGMSVPTVYTPLSFLPSSP